LYKINVKDLCFCYDKNKHIISHFSLQLKEGEVCALMGPSGSGKTTILRALVGLETPNSGVIEVDNKTLFSDKVNLPPEKRNIGIVFQDYGLFPHLTVAGNINFGLHKLKKGDRASVVNKMLELIAMKEYKDYYPYQLSGGQQQRVALARALAPMPTVLLLDEPFSNLDMDIRTKLRLDIKEILKQTNTTCILSTHDEDDVRVICDRHVKIKQVSNSL